jgi:hypothetical protein
MEKLGEKPRPRGRPRKVETKPDSNLTEEEIEKADEYLECIRNGDDIPNMKSLNRIQLRYLVVTMAQDLKALKKTKK